MENEIIEFCSDTDDSSLMFLSNESKHPIILEDKKWPSVEHYLQSKKFEGTSLENEIRLAPSVFIAKNLSSPKYRVYYDKDKGRLIEISYGNINQDYRIRDDWENVKEDFLRKAIYAKFDQNPQLQEKLLETRNVHFINLDNPLLGPILEEYRTYLREKIKGKSSVNYDYFKDIEKVDMSLVHNIEKILSSISKLERWNKKINQEMIEDLILIIIPKKLKNNVFSYIKNFCKIDSKLIYQHLPKTNKFIVETEFFLTKKLIKNTEEEIEIFSLLIVSLVKWILLETMEKDRKIIYENILEYSEHPENINIPKVKREYRKNPPDVTPAGFFDYDKLREKKLVGKLVLGNLIKKEEIPTKKEIKKEITKNYKHVRSSDEEIEGYISEFKRYKPKENLVSNILPLSEFINSLFTGGNHLTPWEIFIFIQDFLGEDVVTSKYEELIEGKIGKVKKVTEKKSTTKKGISKETIPKKKEIIPKKKETVPKSKKEKPSKAVTFKKSSEKLLEEEKKDSSEEESSEKLLEEEESSEEEGKKSSEKLLEEEESSEGSSEEEPSSSIKKMTYDDVKKFMSENASTILLIMDYDDKNHVLKGRFKENKMFQKLLISNKQSRFIFPRSIPNFGFGYIFYKERLSDVTNLLDSYKIDYVTVTLKKGNIEKSPLKKSKHHNIPKKVEYVKPSDPNILIKILDFVVDYKLKGEIESLTFNTIKNKFGINMDDKVGSTTYKDYLENLIKLVIETPIDTEIEKLKNGKIVLHGLYVFKNQSYLVEKYKGTYTHTNPFKITFPSYVDYESLEKFVNKNMMSRIITHKINTTDIHSLIKLRIDEYLEGSYFISKIYQSENVTKESVFAYNKLRTCEKLMDLSKKYMTDNKDMKDTINKYISENPKSKYFDDSAKGTLESLMEKIWSLYIYLEKSLSKEDFDKLLKEINSRTEMTQTIKMENIDYNFSTEEFYILKAISRINTVTKSFSPFEELSKDRFLYYTRLLSKKCFDNALSIIKKYSENFNDDELELFLKSNNITYSEKLFSAIKTFTDSDKNAILLIIILQLLKIELNKDKNLSKRIILFAHIK